MTYPAGTKIQFREEKQAYTIQAANERFAVCTKPFNPQHTVLYTVIDWEQSIRGTENLIFGMGTETQEQCQEMLKRLTAGETQVSRRNWVALNIREIRPRLRNPPGQGF